MFTSAAQGSYNNQETVNAYINVWSRMSRQPRTRTRLQHHITVLLVKVRIHAGEALSEHTAYNC